MSTIQPSQPPRDGFAGKKLPRGVALVAALGWAMLSLFAVAWATEPVPTAKPVATAQAGRTPAAAPWKPQPAPAGAAMESRRVLVVKQGMEHNRTFDGNVHGISSYHRYRIDQNPAAGRWKMRTNRDDLQVFHDLDVDGDGRADNDTVATHPWDLSLDNPISMVAPWYDTSIGTQRFCGGMAIYQANIASTGFSEDGMNDSEEGPPNQPRRNWCLHHEGLEIFSPFRMCELLVWQKPDFINDGSTGRVSFDDSCEIRHWPGRYFMGIDAMRMVVRNGDQVYLSEEIYRLIGLHGIRPTKTRWAKHNPKGPYQFHFDPAKAKYEAVKFDDITAIGWYMAKDRLVPGYVGCKWEAFEADAMVTAPKRRSSLIQMVEVKAPGTPACFMSAYEVPYELWRKIHRVVRCPAHAGFLGFNFDDNGDMGSMDYTVYADPKHAWADSQDQPVTDIGLYDMIAWCNALSVYESRVPCYYEDAAFTKVYREVLQSPTYGKPRPTPTIYVKWDADGFRLPTPGEWKAAYAVGAGESRSAGPFTSAVGAGSPNSLGFYDLAGNVWEPVWTYGDQVDPAKLDTLTVVGGSFLSPKDPQSVSASPYGDDAFRGRFDIGLRLVRREANAPAPSKDAVLGGLPTWVIRKGQNTASDVARQLKPPVKEALVKTVAIPNKDYSMGVFEVTFAQYRPVYDWAVAHGYAFDYGGEMGSMAYWGFGHDWTPGVRTADEPVTGMSYDDSLVWLNALSKLEGRAAVYYADEGFTQVLRKTVHYRPVMMTHAEMKQLATQDRCERGLLGNEALCTPVFIRPEADGYRLPAYQEFIEAAFAGAKGKHPWGDDPAGGKDFAWMADASGFQTHPVGQRKPNAWGLYDMIGNVSEMPQEITHAAEGNSASYAFHVGGSFLDITEKFDAVLRISTLTGKGAPAQSRGLMYPDVGFRILRQHGKGSGRRVAASGNTGAAQATRESRLGGTAARAAELEESIAAMKSRSRKAKGGSATRSSKPAVVSKTAAATDFDPLQGQVHRGNLGRTGQFTSQGLKECTGVKWAFETGGPVRSSPVVVDGVVYVGSHDGNVYAVDAATGREKWRLKTGGPVSGSAAVVKGVVYIASEAGALLAIRTADGKQLWRAETNERTAGSPAVLGGRVFIGAGAKGGSTVGIMSAGPMLAFDAATGKRLWTGDSGPQGYAAVATDGARLYAGFMGSCYGAFDPETGRNIWKTNSGGQRRQFNSMTVVGGNIFYAQTIGGVVYRMPADSGEGSKGTWRNAPVEINLQYPMNLGGEFGHEAIADAAVSNGLVYCGFYDGQFIAFDAENGEKRWIVKFDKPLASSPSLAGGLVYFGGWNGCVHALDAKTGQQRWKHELGAKVNSSPWPGDSVIYVGCDDGKLYAIH